MQLRSARFLSVSKKLRNNLILALSGAFLALAWCLLTANLAYAADTVIKDGQLTYKGTDFTGPAEKTAEDTNLPAEISDGSIYYSNASGSDSNRKVTYIFFTEKDAKKAKLAVYKYVPPDDFKLSGKVKTIDIDNDGSAQLASSTDSDDDGGQNCVAAFGAMSWLACTVAEKSSEAIDSIMSFIMDFFMEVKPLSTDSDSPVYMIWSYMRDIANIAFIIFVLVVVYSQITGFGISNYGIKKTLPRVIMAAILVNLSYFICTVAIDLSNILGNQLHALFMSIRDRAIAAGAFDGSLGWIDLFEFIGGATAAGGLAVLGLAIAGGAAGLMFLLMPVLLGALIAVIAAFITLAARQAIIMLLVIIAPLAFVAFLLPNTEKWFKQWKDLGIKMLVIYPAFSLLLGASQLAGWVIIASSTNVVQLILGMAVQFIPLVFTPILAKLSGNLLGSITSGIRKRFEPIQKSAKAYGDDKRAIARARQLQNYQNNPTRFNRGLRRLGVTATAYRWEEGKRRRALDKTEAEGAVDKGFEGTFDDEVVNGRNRRRVVRDGRRLRVQPRDYSRRESRFGLERATTNAERAKESASATIMTARSNGPLRDVSLAAERAKTVHEATKKRFEEVVSTERATAGTGLYEASMHLEQMTLQADTAKKAFDRVIKVQKLEPEGRLFHANRDLAAFTEHDKLVGTQLDKSVEGFLQVRKATTGDELNLAYMRAEEETMIADTSTANLEKFLSDEKNRKGSRLEYLEYSKTAAQKEANVSKARLAGTLDSMGARYAETAAGASAEEIAHDNTMRELAGRVEQAYYNTEFERFRAQNITTGDKDAFSKYLNETFIQHDRHEAAVMAGEADVPDEPEGWARVLAAEGGRGTEGIQSIRAAAAAQKDAEDQRLLSERETQMGKETQLNVPTLQNKLRQAYKDRDVFGMRAALNLLTKKGSFGISMANKAVQKIFEEPDFHGIDLGAQDTKNITGVLANHIANGSVSGDMRKKAGDLWYWASQMSGKDDMGDYQPKDKEGNTTDANGEPYSVMSYTPADPNNTNLAKEMKDLVNNVLTGPGDIIKQGANTIKNFARWDAVPQARAIKELQIAGRDPASVGDLDNDKLIGLGKMAGVIDVPGWPDTGLDEATTAAYVEQVWGYMSQFSPGGGSPTAS